jgi:group I intron endonuclease
MAAGKLGRKWSEETKIKLSAYRTGREHSDETKGKIQAASLGRKFSEETRAKITASKGHKLEVTDIRTGDTAIYDSTRSAAKELGTNHNTIRNYIKSQKLYRERFQIAEVFV